MWIESAVGVGSTFFFTVSAPATETKAAKPAVEQLVGKQILIVDDNATNRQILTLQTQSWGMSSRAVESGAEALKLFSQGIQFDVAILDMQMPQMDGVDLARAIRQQAGYGDLPPVMLSSLGREEIIQQAQDIKFAAIINKPIEQSKLYRVLASVCGNQLVKFKSTDTSFLNLDSSDLPSLNILLAEDIVVNQKVALLILQQLGYRADVVSNGIEVLEALHRQSYDAILMDVQMPEMDGLTATELICQQWQPESRPRIIAMTANAMTGDREICLAAGMDDYISKPIRVEELREALQRCSLLETATKQNENTIKQESSDTEEKKTAIDLSVLQSLEMAGEDAHLFLTEMITIYLEDTEQRIQLLAEGIAQANAAIIEQAAHSMKSSSANLGALDLAQLCEQLEQLGRTKTVENTESLLGNTQSEFQQVRRSLQEFLTTMN